MSDYKLSRETELLLDLVCSGISFDEAKKMSKSQANYDRAKENINSIGCNLVEPVREAFGL